VLMMKIGDRFNEDVEKVIFQAVQKCPDAS
jgi:hypothetical protein